MTIPIKVKVHCYSAINALQTTRVTTNCEVARNYVLRYDHKEWYLALTYQEDRDDNVIT